MNSYSGSRSQSGAASVTNSHQRSHKRTPESDHQRSASWFSSPDLGRVLLHPETLQSRSVSDASVVL
ncbi:unnamed protein product [Boreogadus saida]